MASSYGHNFILIHRTHPSLLNCIIGIRAPLPTEIDIRVNKAADCPTHIPIFVPSTMIGIGLGWPTPMPPQPRLPTTKLLHSPHLPPSTTSRWTLHSLHSRPSTTLTWRWMLHSPHLRPSTTSRWTPHSLHSRPLTTSTRRWMLHSPRLRPSTTSRWVHKHLEPFHSRIAVVPVCKPYLGVSPAMHYCLYTKDGELTTGPVNFIAVSFIYTSKCLNNLMLEPSFRLTPPATAQPSSNSDTRKPTAFRYPHFLALTPSVLSNWADGDQQYRGLE